MNSSAPGAPYGWRGRFGLLQPQAAFENIAYELYLMAPPGVSAVFTSFDLVRPSEGASAEAFKQAYEVALGRLDEVVRRLHERQVNVILQVGLPPILAQGWGYEDQLKARVAGITSAPLITGVGSCIAALRAFQSSRVAVLNPFDNYADNIPGYVAHAGIEVVAMRSVQPVYSQWLEVAPTAVAYNAAKSLVQSVRGVQALWITGAFMPSASIIASLEEDLGIPVVTNMQGLLWAGLRAMGVQAQVTGYGRLFAL